MKTTMKISALALCVALTTTASANITNQASVSYQDVTTKAYNGQSGTVVVVTPPVVTAPPAQVLNIGQAMTPVTVAATNNPTSFALTNGPAGITINNAGVISGTPSVTGNYAANVTATNAAGTSVAAVFSITVNGAPNVVLTKTANVATAVSGNTVTYTITYQNQGSGAAQNVVITDVIPTGSTYVAGSASAGGVYSSGAQSLTWTVGTVAGNSAPASVTFNVTVN